MSTKSDTVTLVYFCKILSENPDKSIDDIDKKYFTGKNIDDTNITEKDEHNRTFLHYICMTNYSDIISDFFNSNYNECIEVLNQIDNEGKNALHYACRTYDKSNNIDIIDLLLSNGIDYKVKDNNGLFPIDYIYDNHRVSAKIVEYEVKKCFVSDFNNKNKNPPKYKSVITYNKISRTIVFSNYIELYNNICNLINTEFDIPIFLIPPIKNDSTTDKVITKDVVKDVISDVINSILEPDLPLKGEITKFEVKLEENKKKEYTIKDIKYIGGGGYGIVLKIPSELKYLYKNCEIIKVIFNNSDKNKAEENCSYEYYIGKFMGNISKLGPNVCTNGLICDDDTYYYITMELFDGDGENFITKNKNLISTYYTEVLKLIENSFNNTIEINDKIFVSVDIKTPNTLVRKKMNGELTVKLSDFSPQWCLDIKRFDNTDKEILVNMLQLKLLYHEYKNKNLDELKDVFKNTVSKYEELKKNPKFDDILDKEIETVTRGSLRRLFNIISFYLKYNFIEKFDNIVSKFNNLESKLESKFSKVAISEPPNLTTLKKQIKNEQNEKQIIESPKTFKEYKNEKITEDTEDTKDTIKGHVIIKKDGKIIIKNPERGEGIKEMYTKMFGKDDPKKILEQKEKKQKEKKQKEKRPKFGKIRSYRKKRKSRKSSRRRRRSLR